MDTVQPQGVVTVRCSMQTYLPDGTAKEKREERFSFIYGVERQPPSLEKALEGAKVGDRIRVTIPESELYGEYDPELIREIPREGLIKQRLKEGEYYRRMKKGCLVSFRVLELRPRTVLADFNEPMAGIRVEVDLDILGVRKAGEEEIAEAMETQAKKRIGCG